jgi:hypothetical protein
VGGKEGERQGGKNKKGNYILQIKIKKKKQLLMECVSTEN